MPLLQQGLNYRCGCFSALEWLYAYGYDPTGSRAWTDALALADSQHGLSFPDEREAINGLAGAVNATLAWVGDGYIRSVAELDAHLGAGRCVIVGLYLGDLHPSWGYQHFEAVVGEDVSGFLNRDTLSNHDGDAGHVDRGEFLKALADNWTAGAILGLVFTLEPALG